MSAQNGRRIEDSSTAANPTGSVDNQYSYEAGRRQIDNAPNVGGPPVVPFPSGPIFQPQQGTGCNNELFLEVQEAASLCCASEGTGALCDALTTGNIWVQQRPFRDMVGVIQDHSGCNSEIPEERRKAAWNVFSEVTGLRSMNSNNLSNTVANDFNTMINLNAFYMFFPTLILLLIIIWLMVGFTWINWVVGLFFSILVIVILYGFSILYRIHAQNYFRSQNQRLLQDSENAQRNFENSVAYWPQGLFAVASTINTPPGGTGWICNGPTRASARGRGSRKSRACGSVYIEEELDIEEEEEIEVEEVKPPPKQIRKRRIQRRKRE